MGIKWLRSYLESKPALKHCIQLDEAKPNQRPKLIIWDALGHMRGLFAPMWSRPAKLLFDFTVLNNQIKHTIQAFKSHGFQLIAFIDGYHIDEKNEEMMERLKRKIKRVKKNIAFIKQLHDPNISKSQQNKIIKKIEWIPSFGYTSFLTNALQSNGCTVYRGIGQHDIDQDIATFAYLTQHNVYGILSMDTDFFGFYHLPKHIKLINHYKIKRGKLSFEYYDQTEVWNSLKLQTEQDIFKLISFVGNDFVPRNKKERIKRRCVGYGSSQVRSDQTKMIGSECLVLVNELLDIFDVNDDDMKYNEDDTEQNMFEMIANGIISDSIKPSIKIHDSIPKFYRIRSEESLLKFKQNVNTTWMDLKTKHIFSIGFHFHDIDQVGFTIQDKVSSIRRAIIKNTLHLNEITEMKCRYDKKKEKIVRESRVINLNKMPFKKYDLQIQVAKPNGYYNMAGVHYVVNTVLKILMDKQWVTKYQYNALELQFKFRYDLTKIYNDVYKWPFSSKLFKKYKANGVPRIYDLTAQCLYWELCRWMCFNPKIISPNIYQLFDGPLFHFFCNVQANGDTQFVIRNLKQMLKNKQESKGNGKKFNNGNQINQNRKKHQNKRKSHK